MKVIAQQLQITTTHLPEAVAGVDYKNQDGSPVQLKCAGGAGVNNVFSATGLPNGLVCDADGTIHGTPNAMIGDYDVIASVTDGDETDSKHL